MLERHFKANGRTGRLNPSKGDRPSRSICLELDSETDREWPQNLQQRKPDAQLLEEEEEIVERGGDRWFRDLNREEEERLGHPKQGEEENPKRIYPEFPTNKERDAEMHEAVWKSAFLLNENGR